MMFLSKFARNLNTCEFSVSCTSYGNYGSFYDNENVGMMGGGGGRTGGKERGAHPPLFPLLTTNKILLCQRNSGEALM